MSVRIKAKKNGDIVIPHSAFDNLNPEADYEVEQEGNALRVVPVNQAIVSDFERRQNEARLRRDSMTPQERAADFLEWVNSLEVRAPHLPDEALRRENMYD